MKRKIFVFIFMMMLGSFGFPQEEPFNSTLAYDQPYDHRPFDWPTSTPAEHGLDPYILSVAYEKAEELGFMYSVLVIRNGYLVAEQYFNGMSKYDPNNLWSASKCFLSALFGIALRENYLTNLNQKMMDFFTEYDNQKLDSRKYDITIRHLLTMRSGIPGEFDEVPGFYSIWNQFINSKNWIKFAIELPLVSDPGGKYHYSTMTTHILSGIITKATGMSTLEFAKKYLFNLLDIPDVGWNVDPQGFNRGGWDMFLTPRDMARFGYLYLNNGYLDNWQIIPSGWIEESLQYYTGGNWTSYEVVEDWGFGYQWDIGRIADYNVYYRCGRGGQLIFNIPKLNMIIITTTNGDINISHEIIVDQIISVYKLIGNNLLPAADGHHETPPYPPSGFSGSRVVNRSLLRTEYIDVLQWEPNPLNQGENISKYRIYYYTDESGTMTKVLLGEVNAGTTGYWCRNAPGGNTRAYGIASVTSDDRESMPAAITVR